nr:photosystem II protein T [Solanum barbisetum]UNZ91979.1 photosystem II protein T [Solanum barbisetum]
MEALVYTFLLVSTLGS